MLHRLWLWPLLLALLLAPTLGHMHRVVHGPQAEAAHELAVAQDADGDDAHAHAHGWFETIFGHDDGASDCRLYDQLCHGDGLLAVAAVALPLVLTGPLLRQSGGLALARWHALFQARGPPFSR